MIQAISILFALGILIWMIILTIIINTPSSSTGSTGSTGTTDYPISSAYITDLATTLDLEHNYWIISTEGDYIVTLPEVLLAYGMIYYIYSIGPDDINLIVKDSEGTTIRTITLSQGDHIVIVNNQGSTWV